MPAAYRLLGAALGLLTFSAGAQQPTAPEAAIMASVDRNAPANVELLRELVEINSGTMNIEGVRAVADVLEPRFKALVFSTRLVDQSAVHRAPQLVATHPCAAAGGCGKRMLLIGHMDTVFDKGSPFQHWSVQGDVATGPGSNDMKGGLVVMLAALTALKDADVLQTTDITIVLTGDEESHGTPTSISRRDMIEAAQHADVALEFEATAREHGVYYGSISRRSATSWKLTASGKSGHSSGIFSASAGFGAIYELARILDAFRQQLPEKNLTYNVGSVVGGSRTEPATDGGETVYGRSNIIPPVASASGDLRTLSDEQTARVEAKMRAIVAAHLPQASAEITFAEGYPAMAPTEASRALLHTLNEVNHTLGQPVMPELDPMLRGAGDISFVAARLPGLAGVGATGEGAHAPGETVDLPSQILNAKRNALLMYRLSRSH